MRASTKNKKVSYKGVFKCSNGYYSVKVVKDGKQIFGGNYDKDYEAGLMADWLNIQNYGDKTLLNFPQLSSDQLKEIHDLIMDKYGRSNAERISRRLQGLKRKNIVKSTEYTGVSFFTSKQKYYAQLSVMGTMIRSEGIENVEVAGHLYDELALQYYGDYAKLNSPISITDKVLRKFTEYKLLLDR